MSKRLGGYVRMDERKKEFYGAVYDILVMHAGAWSGDRAYFVHAHSANGAFCSEWRVQGLLGFGGKYRSGTNTIDCYREDETPKRLEVIKLTNKKLAQLAKSMKGDDDERTEAAN